MDGLPTWTMAPRLAPKALAPAIADAGEPPIAHPPWREAHDSLMAMIEDGVEFLALLGPAGTGKTWLLRAVCAALREQGRQAVLVRSGELPIEVAPGAVVLVDEAARMDSARLASLAGVPGACIVLADLPSFAIRLERLARPPAVVVLEPLLPAEMPDFVTAWLAARGVPAGTLDAAAIVRLSGHTGGVARLAVQLLRAAVVMDVRAAGGPPGRWPASAVGIGADQVDEAAALRLGALDDSLAGPVREAAYDGGAFSAVAYAVARGPAPDAVPHDAPPVASPEAPVERFRATSVPVASGRRARLARAAAVPVLAASVLLASMSGLTDGAPVAFDPAPPAKVTSAQASQVQAPQARPQLAAAADARADVAAGPSAGTQPPPVSQGHDVRPPAPPQSDAASPSAASDAPASAASPAPAAVPAQGVEAVPAPDPAASADTPAEAIPGDARRRAGLRVPPPIAAAVPPVAPDPPQPGGAPGLVFLAHAGDTLPDLYAKVYRGFRAPSYAEVIAANPMPVKPGAIVVFPAPPGGWRQR